jgi:hypothetical protein
MDIVFQRKETELKYCRVKGVEVLSILAKVKNAKRAMFYPNCIKGLNDLFSNTMS